LNILTDSKSVKNLSNYCSLYYEQSDFWGGTLTDVQQQRISITLSFIPNNVKTILDLGCGDGRITNELIDQYDVIGIDMSKEALKYVKAKKTLASVNQVPFKDHSFDLVLSSEVIEHLPDKILNKAIEEIQRLSSKYILISVPFGENLYENSTKCNKCRKLFHMNLHFQSYSKKRLASLFPDFKLINSAVFGPWVEYSSNILLFFVRQLGGKWPTSNTALCPRCGSRNVESKRGNLIVWTIERINWRIARVYPFKKKSWIIALYERKIKS